MAKVQITGTPSAEQDHEIMNMVRLNRLTMTARGHVLTIEGIFGDNIWFTLLALQRGGLQVSPSSWSQPSSLGLLGVLQIKPDFEEELIYSRERLFSTDKFDPYSR